MSNSNGWQFVIRVAFKMPVLPYFDLQVCAPYHSHPGIFQGTDNFYECNRKNHGEP
jgi:hypothetical protein